MNHDKRRRITPQPKQTPARSPGKRSPRPPICPRTIFSFRTPSLSLAARYNKREKIPWFERIHTGVTEIKCTICTKTLCNKKTTNMLEAVEKLGKDLKACRGKLFAKVIAHGQEYYPYKLCAAGCVDLTRRNVWPRAEGTPAPPSKPPISCKHF